MDVEMTEPPHTQKFPKEYQDLIQQLHAIIKIDPENFESLAKNLFLLQEKGYGKQALLELEPILAKHPDNCFLYKLKGILLKKTGFINEAIQVFTQATEINPNDAESWLNLGTCLSSIDQKKTTACYRQAVALENRSLRTLARLCFYLNRTHLDSEFKNTQEAYDIAQEIIQRFPEQLLDVSEYIWDVLLRCVDFEALEKMGPLQVLYLNWVRKNIIGVIQTALSRVVTLQDRLDMVEYHRMWGKNIEQSIRDKVITHAPRLPRERIRIGFMSSDLRDHPVTSFILPLLENYDKNRFEIFCYSFNVLPEDKLQKYISSIVDHFYLWTHHTDEQIAQAIAQHELDVLFELGGTTYMNKLTVMAYRPAPIQASWLGYPHSSGLSSIDYILVDPYLKPPDPRLLIEKPFEMPDTWVSLGRYGFRDFPINRELPENKNGFITLGTMNNPYKYSQDMFAIWAQVLHQVPQSKFLFVRPESGVPAFRNNVAKEFLKHDIERERILHAAVRAVQGSHMKYYNAMDLTLDTFPHVGGTTTCEALWMGIPTVTLVGPAFFERLSYSNLSNAGLSDLCTFNKEDYINAAVNLAQDKSRRQFLKDYLRPQILALPLGQTQLFAENFYRKIEML